MLCIKMARVGKKGRPYFHLVIVDKQKDPWGTCVEKVGFYDPRTKEKKLDAERIKHWLKQGAQPTDTVHNLLISEKILEGKKVGITNISNKRRVKLAEKNKTAEAPTPTETPAA